MMLLHYAPGSAHSAAVRIVVAEKGIEPRTAQARHGPFRTAQPRLSGDQLPWHGAAAGGGGPQAVRKLRDPRIPRRDLSRAAADWRRPAAALHRPQVGQVRRDAHRPATSPSRAGRRCTGECRRKPRRGSPISCPSAAPCGCAPPTASTANSWPPRRTRCSPPGSGSPTNSRTTRGWPATPSPWGTRRSIRTSRSSRRSACRCAAGRRRVAATRGRAPFGAGDPRGLVPGRGDGAGAGPMGMIFD